MGPGDILMKDVPGLVGDGTLDGEILMKDMVLCPDR